MQNTELNIKSDKNKHEVSLMTYIFVWIALLILTAITITMANLDFGKISILVVLVIASTKSTLVLLYFMHLRHEKRLLVKLIIPISIIALTIFIVLTYSDIIAR